MFLNERNVGVILKANHQYLVWHSDSIFYGMRLILEIQVCIPRCYTCAMPKTSHDSETPAHGQQVITACVFIHHNFDGIEKLFWPKRADTKKFLPGVYELPGGHIDFGEDITAGLKREIQEE